MRRIQGLLASLLLVPLLATGALAADTNLSVSYTAQEDGSTQIHARVTGASGDRFALLSSPIPDGSGEVPLGVGQLDEDGYGTLTVDGPTLGRPMTFYFRARYLENGKRVDTDWDPLGFAITCERLSFNWQREKPFGSRKLETGEIVDEQWAEAGLHIAAESSEPRGTDTVIIFDSGNPTGGDDDLQTPGYGEDNDEALGNLLILAEDVVDADGDGLVDDPDDEEGGGTIVLNFDEPVTMCSIGLIDLDDGAVSSVLRFFNPTDGVIELMELPPKGDNSFQELNFMVENVSRLEIFLNSSGAIPFLGLLPCPSRIDFNTNTFGVPLEQLEAGAIVSEMDPFLGPGAQVTVENNSGDPDAAIVFDTSDPTGDDDDLATPGPGIGNDVARGNALIIAEDAVDLDGDGLVDDPDDEIAGGWIAFDFPLAVSVEEMTVLDIDTDETAFVMFLDESGDMIAMTSLDPLGDNSSQTIEPNVDGVWRVELHLSSSGALASLKVCPDTGSPQP